MWSERPSIDILLQSPCRDCKNRLIPKTCEQNCQLWNDYKKKKIELEKNRELQKEVKGLFNSKYTKTRK